MRGRWAQLSKRRARFRFGVAVAAQSPGFALTAIFTLALGVGANTAVFSVMNAVLLESLPVADPDRVVYLRISGPPTGLALSIPTDVHLRGLRCAAANSRNGSRH